MAAVSEDEYKAVLASLNPQTHAANGLSYQDMLDSIKMGSGGASMAEMQNIAQNGLAPTQGPGMYNATLDAGAASGIQGQQAGNAQNITNWGNSTSYEDLTEANNLESARTWVMNQYGQGNLTAEEAQELENQAFEQQYGSLEHTFKEDSASSSSNPGILAGQSWVETTYTPTDYENLTQQQALNQGESHTNIDSEFQSVGGLGEQLFKMAATGALTAGVGAALAPAIAGLSVGAQGAITGGLNAGIGGLVQGDGLDIKDIGVGALTGGIGGSLSNADGMLGGFIDTGSNLADDAIKGAITGGIGGAFDGDLLGGALMGGATGAGTNLLEQGVGWAGDKINGLTDDLTGPGEFDFAMDVVDFEGDDFDQYMQQIELDALTDIIPGGEYHDIPDVVQDELDRQYMENYNSLQEIVPGGEYREGIQFSETNNWITADGQAIDRNDVTFNQEIGEFTIQGTDTIVSEHANAITIDGQVVAYKDGESWTDLSGEPITDPALVDFYTNTSTQSGEMDLIQTPIHDGPGAWEAGYSDNHGGNAFYNDPDYKGTILGDSGTPDSTDQWGITTPGNSYVDAGASEDIYHNLDNGFYNPDATNNAVTNFLPPEEVEQIVEQQQQQQEAAESDPVNNTDTSLDSGEQGGGTPGTPSEPVDTAVGSIVNELQQEQLQALLNQNPALAQQIAEQIADLMAETTTDTEAAETEAESEAETESETESESETQEETESETETGSTPTNDDPSPTEETETPATPNGGPQTMAAIAELLASIQGQVSGGGGGSPTGGDNPSGDPSNESGGQNTDENGDGGLTGGDGTGDGDDTGSGVQTGDGTGTGEEGTEGGNGDGEGDPGIGAGFGGMLAGLGAGAGVGGSDDRPVWSPLDAYMKMTPYQKARRQLHASLNEGLMQAAKNRRAA